MTTSVTAPVDPVECCSFCKRNEHQVDVLVITIAGGPSICSDCTANAVFIITEARAKRKQEQPNG